MTAEQTLFFCERLLSIAVALQTIETIQLRRTWSENGIWRWSTLQQRFQNPLYGLFFSTPGFYVVLIFRFLCALAIWFEPSPVFSGILFFTSWLISIRWRGLFNGGSDSMTLLVSLGLWGARSFPDHPILMKASFAYIAVQVTLSYFVAGWVKFINPEWRSGKAMSIFLKTPRYDSPPALIRQVFEHPKMAFTLSWLLICFELTFPLAWASPVLCLSFISLALPFHLMVFWIFGLNRFVFAWLSAYPALYFWSQTLHLR